MKNQRTYHRLYKGHVTFVDGKKSDQTIQAGSVREATAKFLNLADVKGVTNVRWETTLKAPTVINPRDRKLWFADKKLGTCYQKPCTLYNAEDAKPYETRYWVKPHNSGIVIDVVLGKGVFTKRDNAYAWLIFSLSDDLAKINQNIQRAASEIA
jgi:hypothetical protein